MSLKFVFNQPKRVELHYWQKIHFIASTPAVRFRIDQGEDSKEVKIKLPTLKSRSLADVFQFLINLKEVGALPLLFRYHGFSCNLSIIADNIQNGVYTSFEEIKEAINNFLDFIDKNCQIKSSDDIKIRNESIKAHDIFSTNFKNASVRNSEDQIKSLYGALEEFAKIPTIDCTERETKIYDVEKIARSLRSLNQEDKQKAEWIIRSKCPRVPYYANCVDIAELPYTALDALIEYFHIEV